LLTAAESPEQFKAGMEGLINGTAQAVHHHVIDAVEKLIESKLSETVPQMLTEKEQIAQQKAAVREDFFSHYPGYEDPKFGKMLAIVGAEVANSIGGNAAYSAEVREAIALKMRELTGYDGKADSAGSNGKGRRQRGRKRRTGRKGGKKMLHGATRRGTAKKSGNDPGDRLEQDMLDMFGTVLGRKQR
jgi:hypothetical protein